MRLGGCFGVGQSRESKAEFKTSESAQTLHSWASPLMSLLGPRLLKSSWESMNYNANGIHNLTGCLLFKWGHWWGRSKFQKMGKGPHEQIPVKLVTGGSKFTRVFFAREAAHSPPLVWQGQPCFAWGTYDSLPWGGCLAIYYCWFSSRPGPTIPVGF